MRGVLQLRALRACARGGMSATARDREQRVLEIIETARAKRPRFRDERITLAHGAGGKATQTLIEGLLAPAFSVGELTDAGAVAAGDARLGLTTDSYVVKPLRFPGGSIGEIAVNGTVNDLSVSGFRPLAITVSMILEEGLHAEALRAEVDAIAVAAAEAGVAIVGGDTKVVERGAADQMYLCTTGVGVLDPRATLSPRAIAPGDKVLVSGSIGEHGTAIMIARGQFDLDAEIASDTCSLWPAVDALLQAGRRRRCTACAMQRGEASHPCSTSLRGRPGRPWSCRRPRYPSQRSSGLRLSSSESTRCTSPMRVGSWRSSRRTKRPRRSLRSPRSTTVDRRP